MRNLPAFENVPFEQYQIKMVIFLLKVQKLIYQLPKHLFSNYKIHYSTVKGYYNLNNQQ
jgi:hypothetical protein